MAHNYIQSRGQYNAIHGVQNLNEKTLKQTGNLGAKHFYSFFFLQGTLTIRFCLPSNAVLQFLKIQQP